MRLFFKRRFLAPLCTICLVIGSHIGISQTTILTGKIRDKETNSAIGSASVLVFYNGRFTGTVSNADGEFRIPLGNDADSIKFSSIGFRSVIIDLKRKNISHDNWEIKLERESQILKEVVVKPLSAVEIIRNAIAGSQQLLPTDNFESNYFYRELIKDGPNYFSVAEAIFKGQFITAKKDYKIKLIRGRSKEDVSYTRLFESFHPGGGPQSLFDKKLVTGFPDFLTLKKLNQFVYYKDSMIRQDDKIIYVIGFDQKPEVHEALDKGRVYINAEDYSIIKYETESSPIGLKYIKHLTGSDKIIASLMNIDIKRMGWLKRAEFVKDDNKLYLLYAFGEYRIGYKEPRKEIDLDLTISTELVRTSQASPVKEMISNDEEWKRKNLVANLPTDFDADFWGDAATISPTAEINIVLDEIGRKNLDQSTGKVDSLWQYFQRDLFVSYQNSDSITLIPIMKSSWEDESAAGMLYQSLDGDFTIETELELVKRSDKNERPDNGFQQAGIIIRNSETNEENNLILCIGTPGNKGIKYFLRKTENGRSKSSTEIIHSNRQWLRFEKIGNRFTAYIKNDLEVEWSKINSYTLTWENSPLQVGLMVMARFPGNGPKMKPDMKAIFSNLKIDRKSN